MAPLMAPVAARLLTLTAALLAAAPATVHAQSAPGGKSATRADRHGDELPSGALARLGTNRLGHADEVSGVAFAAGGDVLLSASLDGTLVRWDAATGKHLVFVTSPVGPVRQFSATADGSLLVVGSDAGTAQLTTLDPVPVPAVELPGTRAALPADGARAVCWSPGKAEAWIRPLTEGGGSGKLALRLDIGTVDLGLAHGDLALLAGTGSETSEDRGSWVGAWRAGEGQWAWKHGVGGKTVEALAVSGAGVLYVGLADGRVLAFEVATGVRIGAWTAHATGVSALCADDKKVLLSADRNGEVAAWTGAGIADSEPRLTWRRTVHLAGVRALALGLERGRVASAGADHAVHLLDLDDGTHWPNLERVPGRITSAALAPDAARAALGCSTGRIGVWPLPDAASQVWIDGHDGPVNGLGFAAGGRVLVSGGRDGSLSAFRADDGAGFAAKLPLGSAVLSLAVAPGGLRVAAGTADGEVRLVGLAGAADPAATSGSFEPPSALPVEGERVSAVAFLSDGSALLSGTDRVRLTALADGAVLWDVPAGSTVHALAVSPDDALVAVALDARAVRVLDARSGETLTEISGRVGAVGAVAFVEEGRTLLSAGAGESRIHRWSLADGKALPTLAGHSGSMTQLLTGADGSWLSASTDGTALVWAPAPAR
jgi:WD40 repeat protein